MWLRFEARRPQRPNCTLIDPVELRKKTLPLQFVDFRDVSIGNQRVSTSTDVEDIFRTF